jgi:tetratricopeptide (TPR) repeat protein
MTAKDQDALRYLELGLQHMWKGDVDSAIVAYDSAAVRATSDETRELVTIRKAEALIFADRTGPEVSLLPGIVMRRRSSRHVYMASTVLMRRFCDEEDRRKAIFYGQIAWAAAAELEDDFARASVLNELGVTLAADSQLKRAEESFEEALAALARIPNQNSHHESLANGVTANLGGTKILNDDYDDGISLIETVIDVLDDPTDRAEACLDLALGYVAIEEFDTAEDLGREGLSLASTRRQVRNANHILGEVCLRTGRLNEADVHFDVVAGFYPEFKNVKQLLTEVDLCAVVNWKA